MSETNTQTSIQVGKVKDAHGLKGELFVLLFAKEAAWVDQLKVLRLVSSDKQVVHELNVKSFRPHKDGLIVVTKEIQNRTQAESLKGLLVEIPESYLESESGESIYLNEIMGFEVQNVEGETLGKITQFSSNVAQDLLVITKGNSSFEVPFVEEFVTEIDYDNQRMTVDLPPGLIEIGELNSADDKARTTRK